MIDDLARNHLVVVIAHRYSTIAKAGTILVLDDGRISSYASSEEAVRGSSYYRRFSADQESAKSTGDYQEVQQGPSTYDDR